MRKRPKSWPWTEHVSVLPPRSGDGLVPAPIPCMAVLRGRGRPRSGPLWKTWECKAAFLAMPFVWCLASSVIHSLAADLSLQIVRLPALRVNGQAAHAHTQGLEVEGGRYYVTARREDVRPKRALLLRTEATGTNWDVWDITPVRPAGATTTLDHPGGMQLDGKRLWIPVAESKPKGHSRICVFPLAGMVAGQPLEPEFEFPVNDHIGAIAVAAERGLVLGANWDTESVYVWDLQGHLKRTLTGSALATRGIGLAPGIGGGSGIAVQDWKSIGNCLYASGLSRASGPEAMSSRSRWLSFTNFLEPDFRRWVAVLPLQGRTELGREAMAVAGGRIYFLPEDLGASNRLFRVQMTDLLKRGTTQ